MAENNDNTLLDLATNVRLAYNLLKNEGRVNGREDYYQGRIDAYRAMDDDIRELYGLDEAAFKRRIDERFAFKQMSKLIPRSTLNENGEWVKYDDGRYTVTCKEGRVIDVEEDHEYNQRLRKKEK
ncbi:hypothetical protein HYU19_00105 [Candidatus Woesearchaeota archaeon]|nr:hypothetical protein [Candidatus Woesearchaeota archaeon]